MSTMSGVADGCEIEKEEWTEQLQKEYEEILSVGEECISPVELQRLLGDSKRTIVLYDGFEPSGRMHVAQGIFKVMNVNKITATKRCTFVFWVADWFALMNDKMGGDLHKIQIVGRYLIEVWKAAGMNLDHVEFKWASQEIVQHADTYWPLLLDVANKFNISRIRKCCQIMGRLENTLTSAQILYPLMQCTDVFFLHTDICQLGVDQRKVNMLAREYCDLSRNRKKPVILSHHMLYGLKRGQEKMSKSDSDSAIFMEDSVEDVERKIRNAYCPHSSPSSQKQQQEEEDAGKESIHLTGDTLKNPCLDYIQYIVLNQPESTFTCGSGTVYKDYPSIRASFVSGKLSEEDLKSGLITELNALLEPVRSHFKTNDYAKHLFQQVCQFKKEVSSNSNNDDNNPSKMQRQQRLNLVQLGVLQSVPTHVVIAPLPCAKPTLRDAMETLTHIRRFVVQNECVDNDDNSNKKNEKNIVLYLSDWTARVCNACQADVKAIEAYYTILVTSMRSLDSLLMEKNVTVLYQSKAILADSSNYWIDVMNVGRCFMLNDVMGHDVMDSDSVGFVIRRLMRVADIMALHPCQIVGFADCLDTSVERKTIGRYFDEKLDTKKPEMVWELCPSLLLQKRESNAHKTDNDEYYLLDDPKVHGKSKMKKAFCEPENIDYCPPITLAFQLSFPTDDEIVIKRSAENGGDVTYHSREEMEQDFKKGHLHPGDLKAAVATIMMETLDKIAAGIKGEEGANKASKILKALEKKLSKKKK